jgi:hypothetical protein
LSQRMREGFREVATFRFFRVFRHAQLADNHV